jgi:outer membrane lipoprotein carrier protein
MAAACASRRKNLRFSSAEVIQCCQGLPLNTKIPRTICGQGDRIPLQTSIFAASRFAAYRHPLRALILAGVLLFVASAIASGEAADVRALAAAVDAHYNHLRSLEAEFTEVYRGSGMERTESGTVWLKKPGKMRWEYRSPREKLFVSDGKDAWFYVPADRQARKTAAKKLEDVRSPLAFLLGKTKLEKELRGLSLAPDVEPAAAGDVVLRGVPQGLSEQINEIVVEINPEHEIVRIIIRDVDGSATEYRFTEQKEDVAVGDGRFEFKPPAGIETVEGLGP